MDKELEKRCALFCTNRTVLLENFRKYHNLMAAVTAIYASSYGRNIKASEVEYLMGYMKEHGSKIFQKVTPNDLTTFAGIISLTDNPRTKVQEFLKAYTEIKRAGIAGSNFLVYASTLPVLQSNQFQYRNIAKRAIANHQKMMEIHPNNVSIIDLSVAVMLGMYEDEYGDFLNKLAASFKILKNELFKSFNVSSAARHPIGYVVAFGREDAETNCKKTNS